MKEPNACPHSYLASCIPVLLAFMLTVCATSGSAADNDVKAAEKVAYKTFRATSFVAKVNLRTYGHHYVLPDGSPAPQKAGKQGRGGEGALFTKDIKVKSGETGEGIYVRAKKKEVIVGFTKKHKGINGTQVHILYGRPITADDLAPAKLARAVSSVVVIRGYEPGADLEAAFDEAGAGEPMPAAAPVAQVEPSLSSFNVRVEPPRIARGAQARVILEYDVAAAAGVSVEVTESRSLIFGGEVLPTFPTAETVTRTRGHHQSVYTQPVPTSAATGVYELEAETCVAGECTARRIILEVTP